METLDLIEELVSELYKGGEDLPPFIHVDVCSYKDIREDMMKRMCNPYTNDGPISISVATSVGVFILQPDLKLQPNTIKCNGRTLLDVIAERELLGL